MRCGAVAVGLSLGLASAGTAQVTAPIQDNVVPVAVVQSISAYERVLAPLVAERFRPDQRPESTGSRGPFRFWGTGDARMYEIDRAGFEGSAFDFLFGIDGYLADDFVVGVIGGAGSTDVDTRFLGLDGNFDNKAFSLGLYTAYDLGSGLVFDASFIYGRNEYEVQADTVASDFDGDRATGLFGISGFYRLGSVEVEPRASLALSFDSQVRHTERNGVFVENQRTTVFRGSLGGRIGYPVSLGGVRLRPFAIAALDATLDDVGEASLIGDAVAGRVGAGLDLVRGGIRLTLLADAGGLGGTDVVDYGGSVRLTLEF